MATHTVKYSQFLIDCVQQAVDLLPDDATMLDVSIKSGVGYDTVRKMRKAGLVEIKNVKKNQFS